MSVIWSSLGLPLLGKKKVKRRCLVDHHSYFKIIINQDVKMDSLLDSDPDGFPRASHISSFTFAPISKYASAILPHREINIPNLSPWFDI